MRLPALTCGGRTDSRHKKDETGRFLTSLSRWAALPGLAGAQKLIHILRGAYGIVPTAEHIVGDEVEASHFRI